MMFDIVPLNYTAKGGSVERVNNNGPRTDPWGTPHATSAGLVKQSISFTFCLQSDK